MSQVSGFTFIKNGLTLGYPIRESIESIEPLCDEIIINVGYDDPELKKDDGTFDYLNDHFSSDKFKFVKSYWDPNLTSKGLILSEQTNIALEKCQYKYCQYIQGDEAIHEDDLGIIEKSIKELEEKNDIDGIIFKYLHFYGSTDILKYTRSIYRREVRLIRNGLKIKSWLDAQGFRHQNDKKIRCLMSDARIFHYGWARLESVMKNKVQEMDKFYHGKDHQSPEFNYEKIWGLKPFNNTHPKVMNKWINDNKNSVDILNLPMKFEWKNLNLAVSDLVENLTGYRIGEYKNFIEVKS